MKGTEHFKQTIKEYLDGKARTDELFAVSYAKENKNLDGWECYVKLLQIEEDNRRFLFNVALLRLKECLKDEKTTPEKFEDQKKLVLSYSLIQEERFNSLKT